MKVLDATANTDALSALRTIVGTDRREVPVVVLRFACTRCGQTFYGSALTPHICPHCESDEILEEAS